jgi:hypothetical protein
MIDNDVLEQLEEYDRAGWVLVALPPDIAGTVVGEPATSRMALALSHRIKAVLDRESVD